MKLFELDTEIRSLDIALQEYAEQNDGDVTEFPDLAKLVDLKEERDRKLLGLGCLLKERRAEANAVKEEVKALQKRAKTLSNDVDSIESFIEGNLKPGEKLADSRVAFSWRKSEAVVLGPDMVPDKLPTAFQRVTVEADRTLLKEALKGGETIEGVTLEPRLNLQVK